MDRKSVSGNAIFLSGCLIQSESKKQEIIGHSTAETELIAGDRGVKSGNACIELLKTLGENSVDHVWHGDNSASRSISAGKTLGPELLALWLVAR